MTDIERLNILKNEYNMLSKTILEVIDRPYINGNVLKEIRNEALSKLDEIDKLSYNIGQYDYNSQCKCKKIERRKRPSKINLDESNESFFDSISKDECKCDNNCCTKPYAKKPTTCLDIESEKARKQYNINILSHNDLYTARELKEKLYSESDKKLLSNRFIVRLNEIGIQETMIRTVSFLNDDNKKIQISMYDFILENGKPIIEHLNDLKYGERVFDFCIEHLDSQGNVVYTEKFYNCQFTNIYRTSLSYGLDDFSEIAACLIFENVAYETSK